MTYKFGTHAQGYLFGDEDTDGSLRAIPDTSLGTEVEFQRRASGVWNDTGIQIAASTVFLGRELRISAAGEWIFTRDAGEDLKALSPHIEFTDTEGTKSYCHLPVLGPLVEKFAPSSDDTGIITTNFFEMTAVPFLTSLVSAIYFRTSAAAQGNITVTSRRDNEAGEIYHQQVYPQALFPADTEVRLPFDGFTFVEAGETLYRSFESDNGTFSFKANSTDTSLWLAVDRYPLAEENIVTFETGLDKIITSCIDGEVMLDSSGNVMALGAPGAEIN